MTYLYYPSASAPRELSFYISGSFQSQTLASKGVASHRQPHLASSLVVWWVQLPMANHVTPDEKMIIEFIIACLKPYKYYSMPVTSGEWANIHGYYFQIDELGASSHDVLGTGSQTCWVASFATGNVEMCAHAFVN